MLFLQGKELQAQGLLKPNSNELIYQGKKLIKNVTFSKRFREAAINMCQKELDSGRFCVIIEIPSCFTVWKQKPETKWEKKAETINQLPAKPSTISSESSVEKKIEELETKTELNPKFLELCQQELSKYIGPISEYVIDDILEENPDISPQELIEHICKEIPNTSERKEYKKYLLSLT